jgi:hypothetical protein
MAKEYSFGIPTATEETITCELFDGLPPKHPLAIYQKKIQGQYNEALLLLGFCGCGRMPKIIYPIFTTQVHTVVSCECGKRAFGEPEDPVSAVVNWNAMLECPKHD